MQEIVFWSISHIRLKTFFFLRLLHWDRRISGQFLIESLLLLDLGDVLKTLYWLRVLPLLPGARCLWMNRYQSINGIIPTQWSACLKQGVVWSLSAHVRWPLFCFPSWKQVDKLRRGEIGGKLAGKRPPKFNSSSLKKGGWKTLSFPIGANCNFQGRFLLNFRGVSCLAWDCWTCFLRLLPSSRLTWQ